MFFFILILTALNSQNGWYYLYTIEPDSTEQSVYNPEIDSSQIKLYGEKRISVSTSSDGGFKVYQDLSLSIGGKLGKYGEINGIINDNSDTHLGFVSKNLAGYSEVYLKYTYKNFTSRFGRLEFDAPGISTPLLGGAISLGVKGVAGDFAAGEIPGHTKSVSFTDITNPNIPLKITSKGEYIVENTERVFLNSRSLKRGEDYSIDYTAGIIYLLPGLTITPEDVLRVQFISTGSLGKRTLKNAGIRFSASGLRGRMLFTETSDDALYWERVLGRDALSILKNSTGLAKIPGWKYVGSGNGDYTREDSIFVYEGHNQGDYTVNFSFVGNGKGEYEFNDAGGYFEFVGTGGSYTPYIFIETPARERRFYGELRAEKNGFFTENVLRASENTPNIFNSSGLKRDFSGIWSAGFKNSWFYADFRYFREIDSLWMFNRDNLHGDGYSIGAKFGRLGAIKPEFFYARMGENFLGRLRISGTFITDYSLSVCVTDTDKIYNGEVGYEIGTGRISLGYEKYEGRSRSYQEIKSGFSYQNFFQLDFSERLRSGGTDNILSIGLERGNTSLSYRMVRVGERDRDSLYHALYFTSEGINQGVSYSLRLLYRDDRYQSLSYRFVYVGDGNGSFSYDSTTGSFYRDPLGSYEREVLPYSTSKPVKSVSASFSLGYGVISVDLSGDSRFSDMRNPLIFRGNFNLRASPGRWFLIYSRNENLWSDGRESYQMADISRKMKITVGASYEDSKEFIGFIRRRYRIYTKSGLGKDLLLTTGVFYRNLIFKKIYSSPGFNLDLEFKKGIGDLELGLNAGISYSKKSPLVESGMIGNYRLVLSREISSKTILSGEIYGRVSEGRNVYNARATVSFEF